MKLSALAALIAGTAFVAACTSNPTAQTVTLTARTMTYDPSNIEVKAGAPVELTFVNEDALEHDFSILEIPVASVSEADSMSAEHEAHMETAALDPVLHVAAEPGATGRLTFTPTKPGTYEFFCTVSGHKEAGMVGTMVVTAP